MKRKNIKKYLAAFAVVLLISSMQVYPIKAQAMKQSYNITDVSTYKIAHSYTFTNTGKATATNVHFTATIGSQYDESPYTEFLTDYKTDSGTIVKNTDGTDTLTVIVGTLLAGQSKVVTANRNIETGAVDYNIDDSKVSSNYSSYTDFAKYTAPAVKIESTNSAIKTKANTVVAGITNPYDKAKAIFDYVNMNVNYDYSLAQANKGALNALTTKLGVCEDYSDLVVAMCRAEGVPSRVVFGYRNLTDSSVNQTLDLSQEAHAWMEFYIPEYGWIIADPTSFYTQNGVRVPADNYFAKNITPFEHIANEYGSGTAGTFGYTGSTTVTAATNHSITKLQSGLSYAVTPYSSTNDRITDTEKLVKAAETSKLQTDIDKAKTLAATIDDIDSSNGFMQRLAAIVAGTTAPVTPVTPVTPVVPTTPIIKTIVGGHEITGKIDSLTTTYNNYSVTIGGIKYKIANYALVVNSVNTKVSKSILTGIRDMKVGDVADIRVLGGNQATILTITTIPPLVVPVVPVTTPTIKTIVGGHEIIGIVDSFTTVYNNYSITIGGVKYKIANYASVMNSLNTKQYKSIVTGTSELQVGGTADIRVMGANQVTIISVPFIN